MCGKGGGCVRFLGKNNKLSNVIHIWIRFDIGVGGYIY